jgi:hypothetical protein
VSSASTSLSYQAASPWAIAADIFDPPEAKTDFDRARRDPELFIDRFCWVIPAEGGEPIRFALWDFQREVLADIHDPEHDSLVVLKARQLGLSWLALAYGLWLTACNPGQTCLILNRNLGAAIELLDRIRFMIRWLPDELRPRVSQDTNDVKMPMLAFGNGSRIISLPSTEDTGSGLTAQYIVADEVAKWKWARETFTAILAILAGGGTMVAISTMKGIATYFAQLWKGAQPGAEDPNGYWPIFIPSSAHPHRDDAWLQRESRKYPDLRRFRREHPESWKDAFQLTDEAVFSEFDRDIHHAELHRESQWPVWRGIDFGYHHAPCYWAEIQADRVAHVYSELDCRETVTEELAVGILERDTELGIPSGETPAAVDPAGKARTSQTGTKSDHVTLEQHGIANLRAIEPSVPSDRVDLIKRLLREDRLKIDCKACPRLAEALESAQWDVKRGADGQMIQGETYSKDGTHEHYLDALGYLLVNVWPPQGPPAVVGGGTPKPFRTGRYGQSEFD